MECFKLLAVSGFLELPQSLAYLLDRTKSAVTEIGLIERRSARSSSRTLRKRSIHDTRADLWILRSLLSNDVSTDGDSSSWKSSCSLYRS